MPGARRERVEELIVREVSDILRREVSDPRIGFVTITGAKISPDLRHARVYVSILGSEEKQAEALKGLQSAARFIRGELGKRIEMRDTPQLVFQIDTAIAHGARIFELLEQVKREEPEAHDEEGAASGSGEGDPPGA
jgi:ribosome-binding factor A